jgi:hypothetical protein
MSEEDLFSAAEVLDNFLGGDDGKILAGLAHYRSNIATVFGREGIVTIMKNAIKSSEIVHFFSARSEKEMDPQKPEVNLRVNDDLAIERYPQYADLLHQIRKDKTHDLDKITRFKSAIIFDEICIQMDKDMSEQLKPYWSKAKAYLMNLGIDEDAARMLILNMFVIRVGADQGILPVNRLCTLSMIL